MRPTGIEAIFAAVAGLKRSTRPDCVTTQIEPDAYLSSQGVRSVGTLLTTAFVAGSIFTRRAFDASVTQTAPGEPATPHGVPGTATFATTVLPPAAATARGSVARRETNLTSSAHARRLRSAAATPSPKRGSDRFPSAFGYRSRRTASSTSPPPRWWRRCSACTCCSTRRSTRSSIRGSGRCGPSHRR